MVKTNKKSLVALVVMAFLLVASIVMAATGAWFTSSDTGTGSEDIVFGKVAISVADWSDAADGDGWTKPGETGGVANTNAMPGSEYQGKFVISNDGDEDVYYKVTAIEVKVMYNSEDVTDLFASYLTIEGDDTSTAPVRLNSTETDDIAIKIVISEDLPNEVGEGEDVITCNGLKTGLSFSFSISVEAVQAANNTDGANGFSA